MNRRLRMALVAFAIVLGTADVAGVATSSDHHPQNTTTVACDIGWCHT